MKFFNLSWQPARVLTTLLIENVVLKPSWTFSGCTLLLPPLGTALLICEKSLALPSPYPSPGQGAMGAGARGVPVWASKADKVSPGRALPTTPTEGGGQAGAAEGSPIHVCCAAEAGLRLR